MRFRIIRSLYLKNVSRFAHSPSSGWHPVGRIQYAPTRDLKKSMRFQIIRSLYPKNVSRFVHSSSLKWYSVGRILLASTFFSCLDTRKEGKRKSRPLQRPGKLAGYMMEIENVMRFGVIWSLYPKNVSRFVHLPSLGWHPVGRMQYAPTLTVEKLSRLNLAT